MATAIQVAARPVELDGCWRLFSEQDEDPALRSPMDMSGFQKTRLRYTAAARNFSVSVTLEAHLYSAFQTWYRLNCRFGTIPTRIKRPDGTEIVAAFAEPPQFSWPEAEKTVFDVSAKFIQNPAWFNL